FGWPSIRAAHVCPMLRCPVCSGPLLWHDADRRQNVEKLRCRDCTCVLDGDAVPLTRESLTKHPPDVLFTTTETLHRHLASLNVRGLFGARFHASRPPRLVLLDEAHTYSGLAGAQAAHVLRRWRHAIGAPVHVVGLSATLADAPSFIARLAS